MPLPIQKQREAILQILYAQDFDVESEIIPLMMAELKASKSSIVEAHARAGDIVEALDKIDPLISNISTEYRLERISKVEKWILRQSLYELLFKEETPPKVVIAEGIRLCRKFGTPESAEFINAILDGVYKSRLKVESDEIESSRGAEIS